jgi:hypothetical protein
MRKIYTFALVCLGALAVNSQTAPTCSLDPTFVASSKYGIWPDSATNFSSGNVGSYYQQNITVKVPKDTVQSSIRICFTRFELLDPGGYPTMYNLPPGLQLTGTPSTLKFPGNANNCAVIWGTPTTAGTYTVHFKVDAYGIAQPSSFPCSNTPNPNNGTKVSTNYLDYYIINIAGPTGLKEMDKKTFNLQNYPNPSAGKTTLKFFVNEEAAVKLIVYNTLGAKVYEISIDAKSGNNEYVLNAETWNSGMYFYTLKYKNYSETKRMILHANH